MSNLRELYNSFEVKDVSFKQFVKEMKSLADPVLAQKDINNIVNGCVRRKTAEIRAVQIEKALKENK